MDAVDKDLIDIWVKIVSLVVATVVALFGILKFGAEKRKDRQELAREKFDRYLEDARNHIAFMSGYWPPTEGTPAEEILQYRLFIASVMWACEEVLVAYPSGDWIACVNEQLEFHRAYFATPEFRKHMRTLHPKLVAHLRKQKFVPAGW